MVDGCLVYLLLWLLIAYLTCECSVGIGGFGIWWLGCLFCLWVVVCRRVVGFVVADACLRRLLCLSAYDACLVKGCAGGVVVLIIGGVLSLLLVLV